MFTSLLLVASVTAADVPQGLFNRSGCSGATVQAAGCSGAVQTVRLKVSAVVQTHPVRSTFAAVNDARPHLLGRLAHRLQGSGCCGVTATVQATGCSGGAALMPVGGARTVITVAPAAPAAPQAVGGPLRDHKAIRRFLVNHGVPEAKLTAHEARVGGSANVDWLGLLMAFVKGGLAAVLQLLGGG